VRLEDVLQLLVIGLHLPSDRALDKRLGELEESSRNGLEDDVDVRTTIRGLERLLEVERNRP
jgi:hypothetical protein